MSYNDIKEVMEARKEASSTLFKRFTYNLMNKHAEKCHLLVRTNANAAIKVDSLM